MSNRRLAGRAAGGLRIAGFIDQLPFLTGLLASHPDLASAGAENSPALQTLLHPEFLGMKFQFLMMKNGVPAETLLTGLRFARDPRAILGLSG